jgi:hypothetical protein
MQGANLPTKGLGSVMSSVNGVWGGIPPKACLKVNVSERFVSAKIGKITYNQLPINSNV